MAFYNAVKAGTKGMKYEIPAYSKENMINVLSSIIFAVTGYVSFDFECYFTRYVLLIKCSFSYDSSTNWLAMLWITRCCLLERDLD